MMGLLWVVFFVALTGSQFGYGLPVGPTPQTYPYDGSGASAPSGWDSPGGLYAAVPALALLITAVGLLFGCTWCYRHKDCKPNQGEDNQLFTGTVTHHLHEARRSNPPDSGFSEPVNNNISEDNNNGPISLREMQNIANNNAAAYIVSENEERNRVSRESVVEFEPLPTGIRVADPLEPYADWFGGEDFSRNRLQYLREIGRGWFGRVVEGEIEDEGSASTVAVKILNQNASLEDKARFLEEARVYRDASHENILAFIDKCLQEDPWILIFEFCSMDLQQYLIVNRHKMASLNDAGVPLRLMCDVSSALAHLHSRGHLYGTVWSGSVLVRGEGESARAVLGHYSPAPPPRDLHPPEAGPGPFAHTTSSDVWSLGTLVWQVCAWGLPPPAHPPPLPDLPCPYRSHLYQVMQLCWNPSPSARPSAAQVHALLQHLHATQRAPAPADFEQRWQRLKPNSIPVHDEHRALVHAPSRASSAASDASVSRPKSDSLTNLHGSLDDVRDIYLTHDETPALDCHQGNLALDPDPVDPWLRDVAAARDDASYYRDVSDVIKNLDDILNSEKTSSSESSHQASPSRDRLSLDCDRDRPMQSSMVKSPGISDFRNVLEAGLAPVTPCDDDDVDRDTVGTLSHSFERHGDTLSQQTLENITPDTPIRDLDVAFIVEDRIEKSPRERLVGEREETNRRTPSPDNTELPNENKVVSSDSKIPDSMELCVASIPSVSETNIELPNGTQDCLTSCDNNLAEERTDKEIEAKSIDDIERCIAASTSVERMIESDAIVECERVDVDNVDLILPKLVSEAPSILVEEPSLAGQSEPKSEEDITLVSELATTSENLDIEGFNDAIVTSDLIMPVEIVFDSPSESKSENDSSKDAVNSETTESENNIEPILILQPDAPEAVQNIVDSNETPKPLPIEEAKIEQAQIVTEEIPTLPISPEAVQTIDNDELKIESSDSPKEDLVLTRSEQNEIRKENLIEQSNDSTVYMDLINAANETVKDKPIDDNMKEVIKSCLDMSNTDTSTCTLVKNESTVYMDLPSMIKETDNFLQSEREVGSQNVPFNEICSSTPIASDHSTDNTLENSVKMVDNELYETKVPDYGPGVTLTKLEQKSVPETLSPFESPTKSHHTDTYDENSSVVLGPFENCTLEVFKGAKSIDPVDLPKEELLAFSSNFSEMNLETPSPLRDGNFLNEVPDIIHDDIQFDDLEIMSEPIDRSEPQSSNETEQSATEKRVSPLTPPNSPGNFLASSSQQKYVVDINLDPPAGPSNMELDTGLPKEVDLNQIELQITTKLAMAENENNLNIEYSGPLVVEGVAAEEAELVHDETAALQDSYLAGNGGSSPRAVELDEECVKALRNELELKLPLAQVANIEPPCPAEWGGSLPPPPELILSYPGALSPIAEETRQQLSAYENDANWNNSNRTDSSESYPEPCNNSTDEVTDLPTGLPSARDHSTYTVQSRDQSPDRSRRQSPDRSRGPSPDRTYTVQKDGNTSKEVTMSADSLNASPYKKPANESPIDDTTYNKNDDERESRCERISQVSPFILSPASSAPDHSDDVDHATAASTLSKTTAPTDAKRSKPDTHCLSKATSIDSWCSNDTLYNVEENFDDLALDPDLPADFQPPRDDRSDSSDTLTHHDDDRELSPCSTYIVHDSRSEPCETFSPDSITADDNHTYTKARVDAPALAPQSATPSVDTKSDSAKHTHTRDLAYGTLMSGLPSYSNCTTEMASGFDDVWKLPQPELVRRSPVADEINITPPKFPEEKEPAVTESPRLAAQPCVRKMDSVDISCLHDNLVDAPSGVESLENRNLVEIGDSPTYQYKNMAPSVTSTPLLEPTGGESDGGIPMPLPDTSARTPDFINDLPNFRTFLQSAEVRPQDISPSDAASTQDTEILLEGDSKTLSRISNRDSLAVTDRTPNYSDFENSAVSKPQDVNSRDKSSPSSELGTTGNSEDFRIFENSVRGCPQDLSSVIDASSSLLNSERRFSDLVITNSTGDVDTEQTSQSASRVNDSEPIKSLVVSPPNVTNLIESHELGNIGTPSNFYLDMEAEEETEQPHSIIITERDVLKESPNRTYDSHEVLVDLNHTYNSHESRTPKNADYESHCRRDTVHVNGIDKKDDECDKKSPKIEDLLQFVEAKSPKEEVRESVLVVPTVVIEDASKSDSSSIANEEEIKCNGNSEKFATVQFLNETFEELIESNVDDGDCKDFKSDDFTEETPSHNSDAKSAESTEPICSPAKVHDVSKERTPQSLVDFEEDEEEVITTNGVQEGEDEKLTSVTENFLQNEKKFCQLDAYFPLLSDIRFTGPAAEIMSTSFTQESPTSPPHSRADKPDAADILKEWDSDSDSHSTNSSSGEFIWKDGAGHETALVPSTHFDHQRGGGGQPNGAEGNSHADGGSGSVGSDGSGDSGSGSEGDEVEFVPSSWDCRAAPSKSSLRSLEQATPDNKKRVVFKRQKYHCVYEYPREVGGDAHSPAAYVPDLSTYSDWDPSSAEDAELGYGQLFGAPNPLDLYPLRSGIAFDYDEDFFISSSTRPFESLGIMSTTSQFFPGMHVKSSLLDRDLADDADDFPPPPSPPPPPTAALLHTRAPSLDFTTPDSGVEDVTPGSTAADDFKPDAPDEPPPAWPRAPDSASSSESVSPASPGGDALGVGGLRHTRDRLKLDLPPSPHAPSPRHARVFSFVLDKPKRRAPADPAPPPTPPPLVMTDDTPLAAPALPRDPSPPPLPEPTFSTFGKPPPKLEPEPRAIVLTDEDAEPPPKPPSPKVVEGVRGEGTVLDSGDEDSGIESSSKATLERKTTPNVS